MADTSLFYWQEKLGKTQGRVLSIAFQITAAKTVSQVPIGQPVLSTFDALASQSVIDNFLGTSSEFTLAQFDATSMGADAFGCLVDMKGQVKSAICLEAKCYSGTGGSTLVTRASLASGLTASTLETALGVGSSGNLGVKVDYGNTPDFDGLTSGIILLSVLWISK